MKRPLIGLALLYAAGILIGSLRPWPLAALWCGIAGLAVLFILIRKTRFALTLLLALVGLFGALAYRIHTTNFSPDHISRLLPLRDQNVKLRGTIVSDTGYRSGEQGDERHRFKLKLAAMNSEGDWREAEGTVLVFISETREQEPLHYGDVIESSVILRVPPPARNPGAFDWRAWLARQNIQFTATIRKTDVCRVLESGRGNRLIALSLRLREHFERTLRVGLEREPELAGVLAGMIIGERSEIPHETYDDFQRTGVFHVFAINGLHVGLVTALLLIVLRFMRVPRRWCGLVAIPLLALYVFATGARPGAVRALVMASVWLGGWMLVRPVNLLNSLAAAALIILVWDPSELFDGGFVLSFTVVTAIVTIAPLIESRMLRLTAPDPLQPRNLVPRWRALIAPAELWLGRLLSCSFAAWIGLVPLMAFYFHVFAPISVLANLVVVPVLGFIIALGLVGAMAHPVWPWLTLTFNNANFFLVSTMIHCVERLGRLPFGHQYVQAPPAWLTAGYYVLGVLLLARRISWPRRKWTAAIGAPALGLAALAAVWPQSVVELTALNLNDGASSFVNAPTERNDWLIDGGGDWSGPREVVPFLRAQGVDRLGAIVLTRGDKAHAAGLVAVTEQIPVVRAMHSGTSSRSRYFWDWLAKARAAGIDISTLRAGDEPTVGDVLRMRVLNPPRSDASNRSDDNSLVLLLEFGSTKALLMSDAGKTVENRLVKGGGDLRAQVIIKGRHSSEDSCTDMFLDAVRPEIIVQSANTISSARYPQPELAERLQRRGIRFCRTDETGAVTIRLRKNGYNVSTFLAQR